MSRFHAFASFISSNEVAPYTPGMGTTPSCFGQWIPPLLRHKAPFSMALNLGTLGAKPPASRHAGGTKPQFLAWQNGTDPRIRSLESENSHPSSDTGLPLWPWPSHILPAPLSPSLKLALPLGEAGRTRVCVLSAIHTAGSLKGLVVRATSSVTITPITRAPCPK